MSKRNNNFRRDERAYESNKKAAAQAKASNYRNNQIRYEQNANSKQVESRIQYINSKEQSEMNVDRLDLIFQRQPKQIQDKLMKLLISYNAVLQYNKKTDLFEVDLLLPFLSEDEKKEFIRQFLEIRKNKANSKQEQKQNEAILQQANKEMRKEGNDESYSQSKEIRKFSFNNNMKFATQFQEQIEHKEQEMIDQLNYEEEIIEEQKNKIVFRPDQYNKFISEHIEEERPLKVVENVGIDLKKIQESISNRLKNAISIINRKKGREEGNKQNQNGLKSILISDEQSKREESIIEKYEQSNHFADSQKISQHNSNYIKEDVGETQQPSEELVFIKRNIDQYNFPNSYQSQTKKYGQIIEQQFDQEQYQPLFKRNNQNNQKLNKNEKVTSFEDYTKKYTTLKQDKNKNKPQPKPNIQKIKQDNKVSVPKNYFSSKEKDISKKSQKQLEIPKTQKKPQEMYRSKAPLSSNKERVRSRNSSSHSRSISTHKESPSKQSLEIKQSINDFFDQHRQNLQILYSEIRSKIKSQNQPKGSTEKAKPIQKAKAPEKLSEQDYILVLDDLQHEESHNASTAQIPNGKEFKSQIIKQYKKEVLVNSNYLSSEDLIRYFKFLHANAKKLYIKFLMNKK